MLCGMRLSRLTMLYCLKLQILVLPLYTQTHPYVARTWAICLITRARGAISAPGTVDWPADLLDLDWMLGTGGIQQTISVPWSFVAVLVAAYDKVI